MSSKALCSRTASSARVAAARTVAGKSTEGESQSTHQSAPESSENTAKNELVVAQNQTSTILSLNDDCLLQIFSQLDLEDLCAVKDCCQRLKYLAICDAQRRFRKNVCVRIAVCDGVVRLTSALLLAKLGRFITRLKMSGYPNYNRFGQRFLDQAILLIKTCISLKCLWLYGVDLKNIPITKLKIVFANIETIVLENCPHRPRKLDGMLNASKMVKHFIAESNKMDQGYLLSALCSAIVEHGMEYETVRLNGMVLHDITMTQFLEIMQLSKVRNLEINNELKEFTSSDVNLLGRLDSLKELTLNDFIPTVDFFTAIYGFSNWEVLKLTTSIGYWTLGGTRAPATDFVATVEIFSNKLYTSLIRRN